jgi:hypothetical protein
MPSAKRQLRPRFGLWRLYYDLRKRDTPGWVANGSGAGSNRVGSGLLDRSLPPQSLIPRDWEGESFAAAAADTVVSGLACPKGGPLVAMRTVEIEEFGVAIPTEITGEMDTRDGQEEHDRKPNDDVDHGDFSQILFQAEKVRSMRPCACPAPTPTGNYRIVAGSRAPVKWNS